MAHSKEVLKQYMACDNCEGEVHPHNCEQTCEMCGKPGCTWCLNRHRERTGIAHDVILDCVLKELDFDYLCDSCLRKSQSEIIIFRAHLHTRLQKLRKAKCIQ